MASPKSIDQRWKHTQKEAKDLAFAVREFMDGWLDVHPQDSGVTELLALLGVLAGNAMIQLDPMGAAEIAAAELINLVQQKVQNGRTSVAPVPDMQPADDSKQS